MNKYLALALATVATFFAVGVKANTYGSLYMDTYEWSGLYGENATKEAGTDTSYAVGVEAGYMDETFNVYGFHEEYSLNSRFSKVTTHVVLNEIPMTLYVQGSYYEDAYGDEGRALAGVGYPIQYKGELLEFNFAPFVGYAWSDSAFNVEDSVMVGWSGNTKLLGLNLTSWHETDRQHDEWTMNGALGAYLDINEEWYTGVQYRYWYNTGGNDGFADAVIARVGMRF
ncbi:nucleoside-specific channel-forming Tsx family protein [Vibrio parahaemolyticus]|uniref:hypothetical protein n=1 Tax=Vibrio parahaemolyticus TaxID=670 RepID=UPI0011CA33C7|nr:hypothetical protein [Vibrio parahaemolyticus]TXM33704.1 hypothetical protein FVP00_16010 [Vibrio parahaemolyticus]